MTKEMEERLSTANMLREQEKYGESAKTYTECLLECVKDNDFTGLIHALGGMSLVYKHQIPKTNLEVYKSLTLAFAEQAYKIAELKQAELDPYIISIAYRVYGDALLMSGKTEESLGYFEKAMEVSPADRCEKGNLKAHIGGITYMLGQKEEGVRMVKEALEDIRTGDMNTYAPRVWETGCLNKLAIADALVGNKESALKYINEAIQIGKEHNLTIRLRESEEILEKINRGEKNFGL